MKKEISEFEKKMNTEIEKRIAQLETEGYGDVKPFNKADAFFVSVAVILGLGIILFGLI